MTDEERAEFNEHFNRCEPYWKRVYQLNCRIPYAGRGNVEAMIFELSILAPGQLAETVRCGIRNLKL